MLIFVPTIPHAGTAFMMDHLFRGWPVVMPPGPSHGVVFNHTLGSLVGELNRAAPHCEFAITPIRSFERLRESWNKRGKSLDALRDAIDIWFSFVERYRAVVLKLDEPALAQRALDGFNSRTGLALKTDWRVVPSWAPREKVEA